MKHAQQLASKPQLALQSYLDGLLQEATEPFDLDLPAVVVEEAPAATSKPPCAKSRHVMPSARLLLST